MFVAVGLDLALEQILGHKEPVSFLLTGVPPFIAATRSPRGTAATTLGCLGLQMLLASRRPGHFDEQHHIALYAATFLIGIASTVLAWQGRRAEAHLLRANTVAEAMQKALLRPLPRQIGPVRAAAFYSAGEGGTLVGGDLYDVCETPYGIRAIIGDVRGKGLGAVQTVAAVLGSFRVCAQEQGDLTRLAGRLEKSIILNTPADDGDAELFVTALLVEIPPAGGQVRIADHGHPPPLVLGPDGCRQLRTRPTLPLGLTTLAPGTAAQITEHPLSPDEVLLLHTDGISETRNARGDFYPVRERLQQRFIQPPAPEDVVTFLRADTQRWSAQGDEDDQAALALTLRTPAPSGRA